MTILALGLVVLVGSMVQSMIGFGVAVVAAPVVVVATTPDVIARVVV